MKSILILFCLWICLSANGQVNFFPAIKPQQTSSSPLLTGLLAYWKMDETSGTRYDSHVNGYHLYENGTNVTYTDGVIGNAVDVRYTTSGRLTNIYGSALSPTNMTISMWLVLTNTFTYLIWNGPSTGTATTNNNYNINTGSASFGMAVSNSATKSIAVAVTNILYHLVVQYDSSDNKVRYYTNGVQQTTQPTAFGVEKGSYDYPFYLCGRNTPASMKGWMDEVGIWNRILSSNEVSTLYSYGTNSTRVSYPFN